MRAAVKGLETKYSQKHLALSLYMNEFFNTKVAVPAIVTSKAFLLDFEQTLETHVEWLKDENESMKTQLINVIARSFDRLSVEQTVDEILKLGIVPESKTNPKGGAQTPKQALTVLVQKIQERMAQNAVTGGIMSLMVREILTERITDNAFKSFRSTNVRWIADAISVNQTFFSKFKSGTSGASLVDYMNTAVGQNPLMDSTFALLKTMRSVHDATVNCRESYAIDELFKIAFGEKFMDYEDVIPTRAYKIQGCVIPEVSFAEALAAYVWSCNVQSGVKQLTDGDDDDITFPLSELVAQIVTGIGAKPFVVPSEAGVLDTKRMRNAYVKVFCTHLFSNILRSDLGTFEGQISNSIKTNKFFDLTEYETQFYENLRCMSVIQKSFFDTADYFHMIFSDESLVFPDDTIHPIDKRKILEYMRGEFDENKTFLLDSEHPAYYKQMALVTNSSGQSIFRKQVACPQYWFDRKILNQAPRFMMGPEGRESIVLLTTGIKQGTLFDVIKDLPYGMGYCAQAVEATPIYYLQAGNTVQQSLLSSQVVKHLYSYYPIDKLNDMSKHYPVITDYIFSSGKLLCFDSPEDMSLAMMIPLQVARTIWSRSSNDNRRTWFLDMSFVDGLYFFFDPEQFPVYEYKEFDKVKRIRPFIANYPLFESEVKASFMLPYNDDDHLLDDDKRDRKTKTRDKARKSTDTTHDKDKFFKQKGQDEPPLKDDEDDNEKEDTK